MGKGWPIKKTSRRRITVTSSFNDISMYQLVNRMLVVGGEWGALLRPTSFISTAGLEIFIDDVNGFPSISDICPPPPPVTSQDDS